MVGIVIVSHSQQLARGVVELAQQMAQQPVLIAAAGGIDDPENPIGTDAVKVLAAIEAVYSDDGVLVLMDLGSALMSAETALDFLPPEKRARVRLCPAPLVEGAVSAVVQASFGSPLEQVHREAMGALATKQAQLIDDAVELVAETAEAAGEILELHLSVDNRLGLHARPAARFVSTANRFDSEVRVYRADRSANAKSINQVATLGVRHGDSIRVTAAGADAAAVLAAIQELADHNFGDPVETAAALETDPGDLPRTPPSAGELSGIAASPGIAIGPAFLYRPRLPEVPMRQVADLAAEWRRLETAVAAAAADIRTIHARAVAQLGEEEAAIFEAHLLFLQDPDLLEAARSILWAESLNAEAAWQRAITGLADQYRVLEDAYMQARAADVLDVGQRVLGHLMAVERPSLELAEPAVLVAADLTPSDTARLDPAKVLGICTELGGATAHSAILARALGIPAVVGAGGALSALQEGQLIALDGGTGQIWVDPDYETLDTLRIQRQVWVGNQMHAKQLGQEPAVTQDGRKIEVAANIGGPHDIQVALEYGAEGVGLFRTEFLFLERASAPTEAEQAAAYREVATAFGKRPLIIRTLDVGGDKPLPYFEREAEENPFLGWRGIRFCLDRPDVFRPQLRAILRASVDETGTPFNVKIMFPMIGALHEVRQARLLLAEVQAELRAESVPFDEGMEVGIMIEVPAAVAIADKLAAEVDFFSIGTNDLTQYVMAADRGNARVAGLANAFQPAVLRMIQQAVQAAHAAGIWVGMCGELAGNVLAVPLLVGLELDELSMSAPAIPAIKEAIRSLTLADARQQAAEALQQDTAQAVMDSL